MIFSFGLTKAQESSFWFDYPDMDLFFSGKVKSLKIYSILLNDNSKADTTLGLSYVWDSATSILSQKNIHLNTEFDYLLYHWRKGKSYPDSVSFKGVKNFVVYREKSVITPRKDTLYTCYRNDTSWMVIDSIYYFEDGRIDKIKRKSLSILEGFDPQAELSIKYIYDKENRLVASKSFEKRNNLIETIQYKYVSGDFFSKKYIDYSVPPEKKISYIVIYNEFGQKIEVRDYNGIKTEMYPFKQNVQFPPNTNPINRFIYRYDSGGRLILIEIFQNNQKAGFAYYVYE